MNKMRKKLLDIFLINESIVLVREQAAVAIGDERRKLLCAKTIFFQPINCFRWKFVVGNRLVKLFLWKVPRQFADAIHYGDCSHQLGLCCIRNYKIGLNLIQYHKLRYACLSSRIKSLRIGKANGFTSP